MKGLESDLALNLQQQLYQALNLQQQLYQAVRLQQRLHSVSCLAMWKQAFAFGEAHSETAVDLVLLFVVAGESEQPLYHLLAPLLCSQGEQYLPPYRG